MIYSNAYPVVANSNYTVIVGIGGAGAAENAYGSKGSNSCFGVIEATGGGGGGGWNSSAGQNGGSGGGASGYSTTYGTNLPAGQGNRGGAGGTYGGGGGGGKGSIGLNGIASTGGAGGTGVVSSISGATNYYAGGGGGAGYGAGALGGGGGLGGGGKGADYSGTASNGVANTGGGGGGASGYPYQSSPYTNGGTGGSGIVIVRYVKVPTDAPEIENRSPGGVTTNGATFNGYLATNGASVASVYVAWGQTNGSVSGSWATTNWWNPGDWTNRSYPSTNMALSPNANYYYCFGATNSTANEVAYFPQPYQYLITGAVTVQPTDPTGRVGSADTAAFTVYRPTSCTNEALTVAYTLGGTATNGTHYTTAPAASGTNGTVTIPAGQTNAVITVSPVYMVAPEQTVVLTLDSGPYAIGAANAATCTLVAVQATTYTWIGAANSDWLTAGNWTPAGFANASFHVCDVNSGGKPKATASSIFYPRLNLNPGALLTCGLNVVPTVSNLYLRGGTYQSGDNATLAGNVVVESNSTAVSSYGEGTWLSASFSGSADLTVTNQTVGGTRYTKIDGNSATYAGKWRLFSTRTGPIWISGNLGTGGFVLTPMGTNVLVDYDSAFPWDLDLGGGIITVTGTFTARTHSGPVLLRSAATFQVSNDSSTKPGTFTGPISGNGKLLASVITSKLILKCPTNDYSGGTELLTGTLEVATNGCLGTGPIAVYPNSWMNLAFATAANWTLTNSISMGAKTSSSNNTATIKVQAGAHRLTAAGSVITAGAFTNAASVTTNTTGKLAITGKFAFARTNETCATLAIGIAGTNGVAGVDYSQLSVSSGDTNLAASITNCDLSVTVVRKLVTDGMVVTNLLATGANFASYKFRSVAWNPGWAGNVQYGNGFIVLTNIRSTEGGMVLMVY